jgi:hypothetical protein
MQMIERAVQKITRRRLGEVLSRLVVHVRLQETVSAMSYSSSEDVVTIWEGSFDEEDSFLHELGHRFWWRLLDTNARLYWARMWDQGKLPTTDYGDTNEKEAFAEAFSLFLYKGPRSLGPLTLQVFMDVTGLR